MTAGADLTKPRVTAAAMACVRRAFELAAGARHARVCEGHLAAALLEDGEVAAAVTACGVELGLARDVALGSLDELGRRPWYRRRASVDARVNQVMTGAVLHAVAAGLSTVTPVSVLIELLSSAEPSLLVQRLAAVDLEALALKRYVAHGSLGQELPSAADGACQVVLHNDPYTTMDFVVQALVSHLSLSPDVATALMLETHRRGQALVPGRLACAEASVKIGAIAADAWAKGYPLRLSLRRVDDRQR